MKDFSYFSRYFHYLNSCPKHQSENLVHISVQNSNKILIQKHGVYSTQVNIKIVSCVVSTHDDKKVTLLRHHEEMNMFQTDDNREIESQNVQL